ncbi:N-formylglutamate amidohydrolase [Novosphingobium profundi]|uniref:N-formylglutamate amidohydrolase n=1 Tax=Novosphingobium profundi TaxID=1774954 RepID=UPI001BDA5129|nr:N-formylglutamate amidohydrolase [Novosphingobium profundi]MBT0671307.1 N-formylglutamate amidohydrolase [Novosphingobium profundi]
MIEGGRVPGLPGQPAFTLHRREPSPLPILVAVPHAGRAYPKAVLGNLRDAQASSLRLEDRFIDHVALGIARATGADLLLAHAPRAVIDLNRSPEDVDWGMVERDPDGEGASAMGGGRGELSARARSGLGLVPRRLPGVGELWRRRLTLREVQGRIDCVHAPYHGALAQRLEEIRARWGVALLVDLHSMPPLSVRGGFVAPQIVVGDRFGASCHGAIVAATFAHLARLGREAAHNRPYAGGYVLDRHAGPRKGIHAVQLEIDRTCYLDADLRELGEGLDRLVEDLAALVRLQAAVVTDLARPRADDGWALAAQ